MIAAEGILTSHGGKTSHAAVIARGMGAPCVCGVDTLKIDAEAKQAAIAGTDIVIKEGDMISLDGTTGIVVLGAVELVEPEMAGDLDTILEWQTNSAPWVFALMLTILRMQQLLASLVHRALVFAVLSICSWVIVSRSFRPSS